MNERTSEWPGTSVAFHSRFEPEWFASTNYNIILRPPTNHHRLITANLEVIEEFLPFAVGWWDAFTGRLPSVIVPHDTEFGDGIAQEIRV